MFQEILDPTWQKSLLDDLCFSRDVLGIIASYLSFYPPRQNRKGTFINAFRSFNKELADKKWKSLGIDMKEQLWIVHDSDINIYNMEKGQIIQCIFDTHSEERSNDLVFLETFAFLQHYDSKKQWRIAKIHTGSNTWNGFLINMNDVSALAASKTHLYFNFFHSIKKINVENTFVTDVTKIKMKNIVSIAVDSKENLFIAGGQKKLIYKCDSKGILKTTIKCNETPRRIRMDRHDNLYVISYGSDWKSYLTIYNGSNLVMISKLELYYQFVDIVMDKFNCLYFLMEQGSVLCYGYGGTCGPPIPPLLSTA